jgi:RNA polymerase sigma factor (sigma-70 family)
MMTKRHKMIDLIDNYYSSNDTYNNSNNTDIDSQKISKNAISSVLPLILKNDLTERQRSCLKLKYVNNLNQAEIAAKLNLSQPTVCRHIAIAKSIVNNRLSYCLVVLNRANNMWLDWENSNIM